MSSQTTERVGRYQLLEPIGVGPSGAVSRAKVFGVAGFERQFAIKRFHSELTATAALAQALSAAARAYGSLEHPRIARMSEFGVAQGTTFTAVELVAGLDALRLIAEARLAGSGLAAGGALALVSQAARAVGYAHGRGLTHLGLAPTNVMITAEGDIKITDFGILSATLPARPTDTPRLAQRIQYLAPEQLANEATSAATDVFALGVLAYELVTGQRTFKGETPQQVAQSVMAGPPHEPPLPRPIVRVLQRCLARSPFERFPDARALADALDAALRVAPVPGTRKDIGVQVKHVLDRMTELNESSMSGVVALNVGTGPLRSTPVPQRPPSIGGLGLHDDSDAPPTSPATTLPDLPKPPMTTVPGVAPPPIPVPPGLGPPPIPPPPAQPSTPHTLVGIPSAKPPPIPLRAQMRNTPPTALPTVRPIVTPSTPLPTVRPMTPPTPLPTVRSVEPPPLRPITDPPQRPTTEPPRAATDVDPAAREPEPEPEIEIEVAGVARAGSPTEHAEIKPPDSAPFELGAPPAASDERPPSEPGRPSEQKTNEMAAILVENLSEASTKSTQELLPAVESALRTNDETASREPEEPPPATPAPVAFQAPLFDPIGLPPAIPLHTTTLMGVNPSQRIARADSHRGEPREPDPRGPAIAAPMIPLADSPPLDDASQAIAHGEHAAAHPHAHPHLHAHADVPHHADPAAGSPHHAAQHAAPHSAQHAAPHSPQHSPQHSMTTRVRPAPGASRIPWIVGGTAGALVLAITGWFVYGAISDDEPEGSGNVVVAPTTRDAAPAPTVDAMQVDAMQVAAIADASRATTADASAPPPVDAAQVATAPADAAKVAAPADAAQVAVAPDAGKAVPTGDSLSITSAPAGARVFIDGSDAGQTPLKLPGTPDRHTVALLLAGHELYVAQVDGHGAFSIPLKEVTPTGGPAGIKVIKCKDKDRYYVFVDGKPTGQTCPTERIETELGPHTVEVYDVVSESRRKWEIDIKDTRLSHRVRVD